MISTNPKNPAQEEPMSEKQRLLQQATWAEEYARSLPVGDIRGFCEAMIDAKNFRAQAAQSN